MSDGIVDLGFARLDVERAARTGDPEVVFGKGKTPAQIVAAMRALHTAHPGRAVLATRLEPDALSACAAELADADGPDAELVIDDVGRTVILGPLPEPSGKVAVVAAGTSDLPVVRECSATLRVFGSAPEEIVDVGVAGLHRLLAERDRIAAADVVVAVAGMEAALPSVLGGLVGTPLIAVPTSVGYGWNLDGLTAWLATLNSCAPGIVTVNVDNGFGAAVAAARIARAIHGHAGARPGHGQAAARPGDGPPGQKAYEGGPTKTGPAE